MTTKQDNEFGMFLGNAFTNKGVGILATFLIIVLIMTTLCLSTQVVKNLTEVETILIQR